MPIPLAEYPTEVWNQVLSVNLTGVFLCLKHEIAQMLKQGRGAIVNIASVAGLVGTPLVSAYTASKHGVVGLTKTAALECAQSGIRVNAVCPGATHTPMGSRLLEQYPEIGGALLKAHPMGRMAESSEMAAAVVWLCSDSASFVTGQALAVDGGYVAQ
jgi:NAD(P)-dependent dehydrogenase (short-subunit alcohol dehydrogenase family)